PPVWVAGVAPNRRPLSRARRWDGVIPIGARGDLTPDELAEYLSLVPAEDGGTEPWDVVAHWATGGPAQEYADARAHRRVVSTWPTREGWVDELRETIRFARS